MHPYIEIIFCLILISLGFILLRKFSLLRHRQKLGIYKTHAAHKYAFLLSQKLSFRVAIVVFTLGLVIASLVLIEKGIMSVVWNY